MIGLHLEGRVVTGMSGAGAALTSVYSLQGHSDSNPANAALYRFGAK